MAIGGRRGGDSRGANIHRFSLLLVHHATITITRVSPQSSRWFPHLFVSYEDEEYRSPQLDRVRSRIRINFHPRFLPPIPNPTDSRWRGEALSHLIKNQSIFRAPNLLSDSRSVPENVHSPYDRAADTSTLNRLRIIQREEKEEEVEEQSLLIPILLLDIIKNYLVFHTISVRKTIFLLFARRK